jgi:hypothetical protein
MATKQRLQDPAAASSPLLILSQPSVDLLLPQGIHVMKRTKKTSPLLLRLLLSSLLLIHPQLASVPVHLLWMDHKCAIDRTTKEERGGHSAPDRDSLAARNDDSSTPDIPSAVLVDNGI